MEWITRIEDGKDFWEGRFKTLDAATYALEKGWVDLRKGACPPTIGMNTVSRRYSKGYEIKYKEMVGRDYSKIHTSKPTSRKIWREE